jgi:hypothetical protein
MSAPLAGELARASQYPRTRCLFKAANETVTSSTTLQDDDDLAWTFTATGLYRIEFVIVAYGDTGDIKTAWDAGSGVAGTRYSDGPADAAAGTTAPGFTNRQNTAVSRSTHGFTTSRTYQLHAPSLGTWIREWSLVTIDDISGTNAVVQLQWAQNSSSGTATTVTNESHVLVTELEQV